jgi:hypothetical protein
MTSHDREFMNRLCSRIIELDGGELTSFSGNYDFYDRQRAVLAEQAEAQYARQQAMLAKEEAFIARFKARASHAAQVQSRVKKLEKIDRVEPPRRRQVIEFDFAPPPRSGDDVAKLERVDKGWSTKAHLRGIRLPDPPARALVRHGRERRGQEHALEARRRRDDARRRDRRARRERPHRLLRAALDGDPRPAAHGASRRSSTRIRRRRSARSARSPARSASRATTRTSAAACSRAASARGSSWRRCSTGRRTSSCSTSRRTIST